MTRPVYLDAALEDLRDIREHIAQENRSAAKRVIASIRDQNTILAEQAMIGRPGRVEGTRELVNSRYPYITVYRLRDGCVEILAVMHTSRRWPGSFGGKV